MLEAQVADETWGPGLAYRNKAPCGGVLSCPAFNSTSDKGQVILDQEGAGQCRII